MTTKDKTTVVPIDEADIEEVPDSAWERDDRPGRFYDRISEDPDAVARFESVLAEIAEHQATLAQVRKAKSLTQTTIGQLLDMDQSEVSRLEHRSDMLLSTLRSFIQASGGDLHLVATFPDSEPVQLLVGDSSSDITESGTR